MRILAACLLLLPSAAFADWRADYKAGVIAAERQEWAQVELLMRRAIAEQPTPDPKARIRIQGTASVPYVPYFYLGLAAFSQGDCATAVSLFEDSRHAAALSGLRENDRQALMLRSCRARLAQAAAAPAAAPAPGAAAPAAPPAAPAARPEPARSAPTAAPSFDTARAQAAQGRLDRVDAALASTARMLGDAALAAAHADLKRQYDPLAVQARQARVRLNLARQARDGAALGEVESALATLEPAARKLAQEVDGARTRTREVALADARAALERVLGQGERQLAQGGDRDSAEARALAAALREARASPAATEGARLPGATAAIEAAARALDAAQARRSLAAQVRGRLQPLAEAYLGGDFARAAQWADEAALRSVPQALAQALLMRAAARHELYILGGERDLGQFDLIRADVRAARQADAAIAPSERAFSPRFRALFASTR